VDSALKHVRQLLSPLQFSTLFRHRQPWSKFVTLLERKVMIAQIVFLLSYVKLGRWGVLLPSSKFYLSCWAQMKKSRLRKKFRRQWSRPLGFALGPPHLFQVAVSLAKRILLCALIVAARVISLDHVGGLKTSLNSVEEKRCKKMFVFG